MDLSQISQTELKHYKVIRIQNSKMKLPKMEPNISKMEPNISLPKFFAKYFSCTVGLYRTELPLRFGFTGPCWMDVTSYWMTHTWSAALCPAACESAVSLLFDAVMHLGCKPYLDSQRASCVCRYEDKVELWCQGTWDGWHRCGHYANVTGIRISKLMVAKLIWTKCNEHIANCKVTWPLWILITVYMSVLSFFCVHNCSQNCFPPTCL